MNLKLKNIFLLVLIVSTIVACNSESGAKKFEVKGEVSNLADQKVYLEQLFFNSRPPEIIDSADSKSGKFILNGTASDQSLFRISFSNRKSGYLFINDVPNIGFTADANNLSLNGPKFRTPINEELQKFLISLDELQSDAVATNKQIDSLKKIKAVDSLIAKDSANLASLTKQYNSAITQQISITSSPVIALLAAGYTNPTDSSNMRKNLNILQKKFPKNEGTIAFEQYYKNVLLAQAKASTAETVYNKNAIAVGSQAPEISLNDGAGKPFLLSSLKGKYVLVDFWASWCGPCRQENPNVVAVYNKYKQKNFTIVGVSLDENKKAWETAIMKDNLTWTHVSDLGGWQSAVVSKYGFDAIPFNVLLDPSGKIIAKELMGDDLEKELAKVLP